jgi:hypothetical protein
MNRKLIFLNVVLALIVGYAGYLLRNEWKAAKARERAMYDAKVKANPPAPLPVLPNQPALLATSYKDVAMKTLFHPTRNPDLPPPVVEAPPPPPPMPALPKYYGTMNLGDGPMALLAIGSAPSQPVKPGGSIGPFKLVDVNTVDITFEWNGQIARRTLDQITERTIASSNDGDSRSLAAAAPAAAPAAPAAKQPIGPGETTSFGFKTCSPNDSLADGTVQNGFRKVTYQTPFGAACRWDPVGK